MKLRLALLGLTAFGLMASTTPATAASSPAAPAPAPTPGLDPAGLQSALPVIALDGSTLSYGLGLQKVEVPGCGTYWGNEGTVWGAGTVSMTRADGRRQMSIAINLMRWSRPHPLDEALSTLRLRAVDCSVSEQP